MHLILLGTFVQDSPLWKRVAINVPALDVVRPAQTEWESLEAGNK